MKRGELEFEISEEKPREKLEFEIPSPKGKLEFEIPKKKPRKKKGGPPKNVEK